ncbi:endonuclease/exonuclease/phosphatase family protein [Brevundimonas fontaquae]|uniref:Endonuclease/exonuclease/phosphatase family protein n=1 Tax=Brevundimonas fontaquae TaxID=2813778 RepID=A0ABX7LRY0_9CAUL|nr:endonuclease/exonuclease/phosphatase family protein [Brevundimonas fontaquae]QSF55568.1 endonuclease/exonuclease/phosphatase family protein [Brevundimonas fontaquae]
MTLIKLAANVTASALLLGFAAFGVAALSGIGHRWVDILAQFTSPVLLAAVGVTVVCLLFRLWPASIVGGLACVMLALSVWPQWTPTKGVPVPGQPIVRVYSANLYVFNTDVAAMRQSIAAADADILVLVELGQAPASRLDELLPDYPHRVLIGQARAGDHARSIIASRYPILQRLPERPDGLSAVGATVQTPIGPINVFGVHLTRPWPYQYQWGQITQVMALAERMKAAPDHPVIAAGDFNSVSSARIGKQIQSDLGLIPAPGWPGTWPSQIPAFAGITIDQVYRSPDLALITRRLGEPTGSDHRPVVTEFTRAQPPR